MVYYSLQCNLFVYQLEKKMKKKGHSLKDIAKELGLSVTTISFVINGKGKENKISDEVIQRVLDYTKKINYRPNSIAQSLRTGETKVLVFMVEDISNPFFAEIARIIEDLAYSRGYKVLFCSNENNDQRSRELIQLFVDRQVDAFIITPSAGIQEDVKALMDEEIPVVLFDRYFPELDANRVIINNEEATYKATNHLIQNGFEHIGFITIDVPQTQMIDRLSGYEQAVADAKLPSYTLKVPYASVEAESTKGPVQEFITQGQELDAIFFSTNYLTQIGLEAIREFNPNLFEKLGIITFDDKGFFKIHQPSISAVSQPAHKLGEALMENIFRQIKNPDKIKQTQEVIVQAELIERDSTRIKKKV